MRQYKKVTLSGLVLTGFLSTTGIAHAQQAAPAKANERLPLAQIKTDDPALRDTFELIGQRTGKTLNIHRMLAFSPPLFRTLMATTYAARYETIVPRRDVELAILLSAKLGQSEYEYTQHRQRGLACGLSLAQIDRIKEWRAEGLFDDRQRAILELIEEGITKPEVSDATFASAERYLNKREMVELVAISSIYAAMGQMTKTFALPIDQGVKSGPGTAATVC